MTPLALFVTCFVWLASPRVKAESVTMRLLLSRENSTYINIRFADANFRELFLCMSTQSTTSCLIYVNLIYRGQDAFATRIQPRHAGVNDSLSDFFTCAYTPADTNVVCNRLDTIACQPNTPHTSFRLQDPCCSHTCLGFVWNDAKEQLNYDNETLQICQANCTTFVTKVDTMSPTTFLNDTRPVLTTANSEAKEAERTSYDHGPSFIVSIVVATIIAVDIIVVVVFILYKKCRSGNSGDIKITKKSQTINTDSFRSLSIDLPVEYVNTDQSRMYSGLDFANGVASDQHFYAKMETTPKLQCNADGLKENIYEEADLSKPVEVSISVPCSNSSDTSKKQGDIDRTYSTIADSYAILEDETDGNREINRHPTKRGSTAEDTYIDLSDESTDTYIKADTEIYGSIHCNDSKICDTIVYANTETCVPGESQSTGVDQDTEYTNCGPRKITIRL